MTQTQTEETQAEPCQKATGEFVLVWDYCVKGVTAPQHSVC